MSFINIQTINNNKKFDTIAIDTNVLMWIFYPRASGRSYQTKNYARFFATNYSVCKYVVTSVTISELLHAIEKAEHKIYCEENNSTITKKEFRSIPEERKKLKETLNLVLQQISEAAEIKGCTVQTKATEKFVDTLETSTLDCNDYILIEYCRDNNIKCILTDDVDFKSILNEFDILSANNHFRV